MARRPAFTLVELLVVIVIILILAALLFPVFGRAREKARQTTCISNQRQIAQAFMMAIQDNKEAFPGELGGTNHDWIPTDADQTVWREELDRNADAKLFNCPSTNSPGTTQSPEIGANFYLYGVAQGDVKNPANVVLTADANANLLTNNGDVALTRHGNGYVASYVDGHADFTPAASSAVIWGSGDEGTVLSFAALNVPVSFTDDNAATGQDSAVGEGEAVLLTNEKDGDITAKVAVSGGTNPPAEGLIPDTANLKISKGKSKAFALYCYTDAGGQKVDTTYTFGDATGTNKVTVICRKPKPPEEQPQP